jgi:predicted TIM-barrel fold metal-dependent hydrolase
MRSHVCDHGRDAVLSCCGNWHQTSRRQFLGGVFASAAVASFPSAPAQAQITGARRIDVHHHITPPAYIEELSPMKNLTPMTLSWTPERAIEEMDKGGVETSITSITTPGLWFGSPNPARRLARACNDYAAKLNNQYPKRFGMFVNLPLPDIEGSLKEIEYGLDVLKADGVSLFTSYGDKWLGDPAFDPVFAELNRRKAIVYTHPTTANCCTNLVPQIVDSSIEYGADTTRAIARMIFGGASSRFPDIRLIWSHGGGVMPYLIDRFINDARKPEWRAKFPNGFMPEAQRFFYDTAQVPNKAALSALKAVIPTSKLLFGTDFPFLTAEHTAKGIAASGVFDAAEMQAIDRGNALALMPQYRT